MPSFEGLIGVDERWHLVNYLRDLTSAAEGAAEHGGDCGGGARAWLPDYD